MLSMKVNRIAISIMLLAVSAVAASQPVFLIDSLRKRTPGYDTSTSWCGAVYENSPLGSGFSSVVGTFDIPTASAGPPPDTSWGGYAWVGIDGWSTNSILQGGAGWSVSTDSETYYYVWTEWYPNPPYTVAGFTVSPGDSLRVTATATSNAAGYITFENLATSQTTTVSLTAPGPASTLAQSNAAWVVEAYCADSTCNGSHAPFADFGTITFSDCMADLTTGETIDLADATTVDMTESRAYADIPNDSEVVITYGLA